MNKRIILGIVVLAVVVIAVALFKRSPASVVASPTLEPSLSVSILPSSPTPTPTLKASPVSTKPTPGLIITPTKIIRASIQDSGYVPTSITATRGDVVIFSNMGARLHTVTAVGGAFNSATIDPGESWNLETADLARGTYQFKCQFDQSMSATLVIK